MIKLTQAEVYASNSLNMDVKEAQDELNRRVQARDAYIALLELKYNATFNREKLEFIPKNGAKDPPAAKAELTGKKEADK